MSRPKVSLAGVGIPRIDMTAAAPLVVPWVMVTSPAKESKEKTIGSVKMLSDGVIVLTLRAKTGGVIGDAEFSFTKDEPKYAEILRHVGGLKPGEEKGFPEVPVVQE